MRLVLDESFDEFTLIFVDNILCVSKTFQEHIEHLENIFRRILHCNMTLNIQKSQFFKEEVRFLGFIFSDDGMRPDPRKIQAIQEFPVPKNQKQVRGFLGLCQFFSKFLRTYADTVKPILHLTGKKSTFLWTELEQTAFEDIKQKFLNCVMLHFPDTSKPYKRMQVTSPLQDVYTS